MNRPYRILLFGNKGQLGWELERTLACLGELTACDYPAIDLAEHKGLRRMIRDSRPDLLVNAAAYTAVDRAETEAELAQSINAQAPAVMAEEALRGKFVFIHYSTDYVFDGQKGAPFLEKDMPHPLNVYGSTKLAGEQAVRQVGCAGLVLRTSWVYSLRRDSFVSKVLGWARTQTELRLVTDQVSGPTWARMLAEITSQLISLGGQDLLGWATDHAGLYHLAGSGWCSRYEWGKQVLQLDPHKEQQVVQQLVPARTEEFLSPACRPLFSVLSCDHFFNTFHLKLPDWKNTLKLAMEIP